MCLLRCCVGFSLLACLLCHLLRLRLLGRGLCSLLIFRRFDFSVIRARHYTIICRAPAGPSSDRCPSLLCCLVDYIKRLGPFFDLFPRGIIAMRAVPFYTLQFGLAFRLPLNRALQVLL